MISGSLLAVPGAPLVPRSVQAWAEKTDDPPAAIDRYEKSYAASLRLLEGKARADSLARGIAARNAIYPDAIQRSVAEASALSNPTKSTFLEKGPEAGLPGRPTPRRQLPSVEEAIEMMRSAYGSGFLKQGELQKVREVQACLMAVWSEGLASSVTNDLWGKVTAAAARRLVASEAIELPEGRPILLSLGRSLITQVDVILKNGAEHSSELAIGVVRLPALELLGLSKQPAPVLRATLADPSDPATSLQSYQWLFEAIYRIAQDVLRGVPGEGEVSRRIAGRVLRREGNPIEEGRQFSVTWRRSYDDAHRVLGRREGASLLAARLTNQVFGSFQLRTTDLPWRRAILMMLGTDPSQEVIFPSSLTPTSLAEEPSGARSMGGFALLMRALNERGIGRAIQSRLDSGDSEQRAEISSLLGELGAEITTIEQAREKALELDRLYLRAGAEFALSGEGIGRQSEAALRREVAGLRTDKPRNIFVDPDSEAEAPPRLRGIYETDIGVRPQIRSSPSFQTPSEMVAWVIENKEVLDRTEGSKARYSYSEIVDGLIAAGKHQGDPRPYRAAGHALEYTYHQSRGEPVEKLTPSSSFRGAVSEVVKNYSGRLRAETVSPAIAWDIAAAGWQSLTPYQRGVMREETGSGLIGAATFLTTQAAFNHFLPTPGNFFEGQMRSYTTILAATSLDHLIWMGVSWYLGRTFRFPMPATSFLWSTRSFGLSFLGGLGLAHLISLPWVGFGTSVGLSPEGASQVGFGGMVMTMGAFRTWFRLSFPGVVPNFTPLHRIGMVFFLGNLTISSLSNFLSQPTQHTAS